MNKIKNKKPPLFYISNPREMKPLEQVCCMVWLAQNHTLEELRQRQSLIEQQFNIAAERNLPAVVFDNLGAMQDNAAAAVAYQTLSGNTWMAFINL